MTCYQNVYVPSLAIFDRSPPRKIVGRRVGIVGNVDVVGVQPMHLGFTPSGDPYIDGFICSERCCRGAWLIGGSGFINPGSAVDTRNEIQYFCAVL